MRVRESLFIVKVKAKLVYSRINTLYAGLGLAGILAIAIPFVGAHMHTAYMNSLYEISPGLQQLVGAPAPSVLERLEVDEEDGIFAFNPSGRTATESPLGDGDGPDPEAALQAMSLQSESGESNTELYSADVYRDSSRGMSFYDNSLDLGFNMTPQFDTLDGELNDGYLIYPLDGVNGKLVYTPKNNGIKEDILLNEPIGDEISYSYKLKLPDTLEARLLDDGSVGIFSADLALFGDISFGSDEDQQRIQEVRVNSDKNHLVFGIPAPIIKHSTQTGDDHDAQAEFSLEDDIITVHSSGLEDLTYPIAIDPSVVVTSSGEFGEGNNEGMIEFGTDEISRSGLSGGELEAWGEVEIEDPPQGAQFTARDSHATTVYGGFIYVTGGQHRQSDTVLDEVVYAQINTDGTLGDWQTGPSMNRERYRHEMVAYDNHIYAIAGEDDSGTMFQTERAPINPDGSLGEWTGDRRTPDRMSVFGIGVHEDGYIYIVGGWRSGPSSDVHFAEINADGSLSQWQSTSSLNNERYFFDSVVYGDYIYAVGGRLEGGNALNSVEYAPINSDGSLGSWQSTATFPAVVEQHAVTAANGYVYVAGGLQGTGPTRSSTVRYSEINTDGSLGGWSLTDSLSDGTDLHEIATNDDYIYITGGRHNNTDSTDTVEYAEINTDGTLSGWGSTESAGSDGRDSHSSVVHNGHVYVIGGNTDEEQGTSSVKYASINSESSIGHWQETTSLLAGRRDHASIVYNGHIYVFGGDVSGANNDSVEYAAINPDGSLGAWQTATNMSTPRESHDVVVSDGHIYAIGGNTGGSSFVNSVEYTAINPDGSLAPWQSTSSLSNGRSRHTAVVANDYVYAIGGSSGATSYINSVEYAEINPDGTLGSWQSTSGLTINRYNHTSVVEGGYLYAIGGGGDGGSRFNSVEYAPIQSDGSLGEWYETDSLGSFLTRHSSFTHEGYIYTVEGLTTNRMETIEYTKPHTPGYTTEYQNTTVLPQYSHDCGFLGLNCSNSRGRRNHASVAYNGYIYIIGGSTEDDEADNNEAVYYTAVNSDGTLGSWQSTSSLNQARWQHSAVTANGYVYAIGGTSSTSSLASVEYAPINANGSLGSWQNTTMLASTNRLQHESVVHNDYIYTIGGGSTSSNALDSVQYAPINSNGTLGSWQETSSLITARRDLGATVSNGYVYAVGGMSGSSIFYDSVEYAEINPDGTLGAWQETTSTPSSIRGHSAVAYNGNIYRVGGGSNALGSTSVIYAEVNPDGTLGDWQDTNNFMTRRRNHSTVVVDGYMYVMGGFLDSNNGRIETVEYARINNGGPGSTGSYNSTANFSLARAEHSSVVYNGYLYVIGGRTGATNRSSIEYALINPDGTLDAWSSTTSLPSWRYDHTSFAYNGYLYAVGGSTLDSNDVVYAPINSDGTVDTWSATTNFSADRRLHTSVVYNGYLYVLGGFSGSTRTSDVSYTQINADGTLGTWSTTTSFTTARYGHTSVVYNGYLYVIGGNDASTRLNDVQYAPINPDGTLGTWSTTTSFTTARNSHTSVAYNGYLYVIGGYDSNDLNDVQYAPINTDGTVGSWSTTTSFITTRRDHTSVAYNGYLYVIGGRDNNNRLNDVQYASFRSIPRIGYYSRLLDFGSNSSMDSFEYMGNILSHKGMKLSYRLACQGEGFGPASRSSQIAPGQLRNLSGNGRYMFLNFKIDDGYGAPFPDASSSISELTVNYQTMTEINRPAPEQRLRVGNYFENQEEQPYDVLPEEGVVGGQC